MEGHNIVVVYGSHADAERARDRLIQFGIPDIDIRISGAGMPAGGTLSTPTPAADTGMTGSVPAPRHESFWDWLFGRDIPETDRGWYETNLRQGRTVLSVLVRNEAQRYSIEDILDEFAPVGLEHHGMAPTAMPQTGIAGTSSPSLSPMSRPEETALSSGDVRDERMRADQAGDQVIPVVKEELAIGKRASERHYRIRTYVVETPVEKEITLRDERVVVEHRPVAGDRAPGTAEIPREREYEVIERHEEPVIEKRMRNVEDVVVRKEANERTETVRDTVRETRVEVENEAGAPVPAEDPGRPLPAERKP